MNEKTESLLAELATLQSELESNIPHSQLASLISVRLPEIGERAAAAGFPGLLDVCLLLKDGLDTLPDSGANLAVTDAVVLATWPEMLINYINTPGDAACKDAVMRCLCRPAWGAAVSSDMAEMLEAMLDIVPDSTIKSAGGMTELDRIAAPASEQQEPANSWKRMDKSVSRDLSPQTRELVEIMIAELGNINQSIEQLLTQYALADGDGGPNEASIMELSRNLEFYSEAVKSIDFKGLAEVVMYIRHNVLALSGIKNSSRDSILALLGDWPPKLLAYLRNPMDKDSMRVMLDFLQDKRWPVCPDSDQATLLESAFWAQEFKAQDDKPGRKQTAANEDVSLALQDDVSRELLDGLLQELPLQTEQFSSAIQRLINGGALDDIIIAKRVAHTLKGAGNTVGIRGIATLTHHLEDILLALSKNERLPGPRIAETLMSASDCLAAMSESLLGLGEPPGDAVAILQEVLDLANRIDMEGLDAVNDQAPIQRSSGAAPATAAPAPAQEASDREPAAMIRVSSGFIDHLLRLAGETIIMTGQIRNSIKVTLAEMKEMQKNFEQLKQLGGKVEQIIDIRNLNQTQLPANNGQYDALEMDQYTELHMFNRQLVEKAMDADEISRAVSKNLLRLEDMLVDQSRINDEMQEGVMHTRMVPVRSQFPRLQRCVRQAEKLTGKIVDLQLDGGDTLMDSDSLNNLLDPLMHLLRNAVDHGIEPEEVRTAAGKNARGAIGIEFLRQGNDILARCRDDGRGLDWQAIRRKAVEQELLQVDQDITEEHLKQIIMRSGFSTRAEASQVSGRGIGMDAVNAAVMAMSGSLKLESVYGQGCLFEIRIPQNMISQHTLLIRVGPQIVAIANRGITQIIHHDDGRLSGNGNDEKMIFHSDGRDYPALAVNDLLNIATERRARGRQPPTAILFQTKHVDGGTLAVMVEKIISTAELVVKEMGHYVPKIPGILGAAILGDGSVTPVLDLPELMRARASAGILSQFTRTDFRHARLPTALVVDDSLSARRSLEQFMRDAGYTVRTARDGLEAYEMINTHKPDILLSDLEMPRMNGLELISKVRADHATADLPIILITSRAAARHRQEAMDTGVDVYLTKPFSEDELLDHIHKLRRVS